MIVDSYRFDKLSKSECSNTISYCGTISIEKDGVDTLIKAFALISNKYPNHKLIIYGKCPKIHDLKLIRNLIIQHNLEKRVVLPGIVTYEEMPKCLKNSDVLVLARPNNLQARCGFPTKLGEYLLTENPVVVTAVGDIPRFLSNRFSALLAQPSNVVEISNQIAWAIDNPQQALKIGRNGAKVALRSFNYLVETHKILSIIYESKN